MRLLSLIRVPFSAAFFLVALTASGGSGSAPTPTLALSVAYAQQCFGPHCIPTEAWQQCYAECYRQYEEDRADCQRIFPEHERYARRACYAATTDRLGRCQRNC